MISAKRSKSVCGVPRGSFRWEKMSPSRRRTVALSRPGSDQRFEEGLRRLVLLVHVAERGLEHVGRLARAPRDQVQHRDPVLRPQAGRPARLGRALQVLGRVLVAGVSGRQAQLEQDLAELVGIRALGHGALQVSNRRGRVAERLRAPGGAAERGPRPVALARIGHQQVRRHRHGIGLAVGEHQRRLLVRARALHGRHVVLDRGAQDRVGEAKARLPGHQPRALQLRRARRRRRPRARRPGWPRP